MNTKNITDIPRELRKAVLTGKASREIRRAALDETARKEYTNRFNK